MSIRAIYGFDHLPQGVTTWFNYVDHGMTRNADLSANSTLVNGWITSGSAAAGGERYNLPITDFVAAPVGKFWFGARFKIISVSNAAAGILYFNGNYLFIVSQIPGYAAGVEAFIEASYNFATGVCERWINGVKLADQSITANQRTMVIGLESKGSTANQVAWRDMYVCDDQNTPVGPLGYRVVKPIYGAAADGPNWTTNPPQTNLLTAISSPGSVPTDAIATSPASPEPLTMRLATSIDSNLRIDAIELTAGISSGSGAATTAASKLVLSGSEVTGRTLQAPNGSYNYNGLCGVYNRTPSGERWDVSSINSTDLVLTPSV